MDFHDLTRDIHRETDSKIVLVVADGLGGLPAGLDGATELETAPTPNLDELARQGTTGLIHPVLPGITCGSGPGHLALFGYDPLKYRVGRGVLSALGVEFELQDGDVAARGNFCTVDKGGKVTDRRAGRSPDESGRHLHEQREVGLNPRHHVLVLDGLSRNVRQAELKTDVDATLSPLEVLGRIVSALTSHAAAAPVAS